ncbi:MAG: tryptophan--tRNA ligase [Candidatus Wallbacteria bacterium HGW-Wallbacteria-1]|jgi:tryptophanyl-tRNA synthetase|uniref:Tryptophan--tRNA ligase n=1 Tax=Candidatus Wallbacteria bacterium HGW-Wallbacteria-1 TaxID=2013854 RepID=A0A2N1PM96_9BACT|nr:MAG: tryptophan--tRNA ligase [Candidatus Wallbacteria bacterium HGW-Wallbacteria-1]
MSNATAQEKTAVRRVLSGIQPSGFLHLGNYFAMMKTMVDFQESENTELFAFIVNYHALTSVRDGKTLRDNTIGAAMDFLALGLNPDKSVFWVQSDVPEVMELAWYLSCMTPMGLLERCHSYKDKVANGITPNHGLFAYPTLMAADILLYQADTIPVGKDQKQHVEVTRDIAIKFNNSYGDTFVLPQEFTPPHVATVPGIDGQKMSKSYDNYIEIFGKENEIRKKVMSIVTDCSTVEDSKDPEKCNLYSIYKLFATPDQASEMADRYRAGGLGYGEVKKQLFAMMWEYFAPFRARREELAKDRAQVEQILAMGAEKASRVAMHTMRRVRRKVGTAYRKDR